MKTQKRAVIAETPHGAGGAYALYRPDRPAAPAGGPSSEAIEKPEAFVKGQRYAGGAYAPPNQRPAAVKEMIEEALNRAGGAAYLAEQSALNPAAFLTLVGKLLPRKIEADLSLDMAERIREARQRVEKGIKGGDGHGG